MMCTTTETKKLNLVYYHPLPLLNISDSMPSLHPISRISCTVAVDNLLSENKRMVTNSRTNGFLYDTAVSRVVLRNSDQQLSPDSKRDNITLRTIENNIVKLLSDKSYHDHYHV